MAKVPPPRAIHILGHTPDGKPVRASREVITFITDLWTRTGGDTDNVLTAISSSAYAVGNPPSFVWRSDTSGVFPAGDPTQDSLMTFYDPDGVSLGAITLRGTLTTSSGNIAITEVSADSGIAYTVDGDGTDSVRADITITLSSGKLLTSSLSWNSIDLSVAGGTPASGGSK